MPARHRTLCSLLALLAAGCHYTAVQTQCPTCTVVSRAAEPPPLTAEVRTLFLIVPGLLGFGWEWDEPVAALRRVPGAVVEVFEWRPSSSAGRVGRDLAAYLERRFAAAPRLDRVLLLGHSAGGLATVRAAAEVHVPAGRRVEIVNIGTPYAGMHTTPFEGPIDGWWAPVTLAIGGVLTRYPPPAPGVHIESWITPSSTDPVMKPRFGHHPDDPLVGPPGPRHRVPAGGDHNRVVAEVVEELARRVTAEAALPMPSLQSLREISVPGASRSPPSRSHQPSKP